MKRGAFEAFIEVLGKASVPTMRARQGLIPCHHCARLLSLGHR